MNLLKKNDEVKMLTKLFSNQILQKNYIISTYIEFPLTLAIFGSVLSFTGDIGFLDFAFSLYPYIPINKKKTLG